MMDCQARYAISPFFSHANRLLVFKKLTDTNTSAP